MPSLWKKHKFSHLVCQVPLVAAIAITGCMLKYRCILARAARVANELDPDETNPRMRVQDMDQERGGLWIKVLDRMEAMK